MIRILFILIPILTFLIPARWFSTYVAALSGLILFVLVIFGIEQSQVQEPEETIGTITLFLYISFNLGLLAVRYWLVRRARSRITKLPAPMSAKDYFYLTNFIGGYFHQDYDIEGKTDTAVIQAYMRDSPEEGVMHLIAEIDRFLDEHPAHRLALFTEYFKPDAVFYKETDEGLTQWLRKVQAQLRA